LALFGTSWKQKTSKLFRIVSKYGKKVELYLPYSVFNEKMRSEFFILGIFTDFLDENQKEIDDDN
jgi:hypothetical protein